MTRPAPDAAVPVPKNLATKSLSELTALAQAATAQMRTTVEGVGQDEVVRMSSGSFAAITALLGQLAVAAATRDGDAASRDRALSRIARLDIRGGRELVELGAWKKIAEEFQAIAQEAVNGPGAAKPDRRREAAGAGAKGAGLKH